MPLTEHQKNVVSDTVNAVQKLAHNLPQMHRESADRAVGILIAAQLVDLNASMESISFKLGELVDAINSKSA